MKQLTSQRIDKSGNQPASQSSKPFICHLAFESVRIANGNSKQPRGESQRQTGESRRGPGEPPLPAGQSRQRTGDSLEDLGDSQRDSTGDCSDSPDPCRDLPGATGRPAGTIPLARGCFLKAMDSCKSDSFVRGHFVKSFKGHWRWCIRWCRSTPYLEPVSWRTLGMCAISAKT